VATYITPQIVAKEALIVLENETIMAGLVHRDYSREFKKVGSTVTIRKPTSMTASAVSDTVHMNTVTESSVNVVLDQHLDVSFEITTQDLTLKVVDFTEQHLMPAMRGMASTVDELLTNLYADVAGHYAVSATPMLSDIAYLEAVQDLQAVPKTDRRLVLDPYTRAGYLSVDAFVHAEKRGDGGKALRTAELGHVLGYDTYMDQNIVSHSQPIADAVGAADGAVAAESTSHTIDAITSGGTILAGDSFKYTGYDEWFVVATNATADGTTAVVHTDNAVGNSAIDDNTVVTFQGTHRANLAFHKNAFALVTAPLAPPIGGVAHATVSYRGLTCRVVYDYTTLSKKNLISIDMLCGVKTLDQKLAARLCDTRSY